jgi:hypothetical protein
MSINGNACLTKAHKINMICLFDDVMYPMLMYIHVDLIKTNFFLQSQPNYVAFMHGLISSMHVIVMLML